MNCLQCREQMAQSPSAEARTHLSGCPACGNWWNEHLAKRVLAPAAAGEWQPSAGLVDRVMAALPLREADPIQLALGDRGLSLARRIILPLALAFTIVGVLHLMRPQPLPVSDTALGAVQAEDTTDSRR